MGAILSLWWDQDSDWDHLPPHIKQNIYRQTQADTNRAEGYANAPRGYMHWLRTSAIGPAILDRVMNHESFHHINNNAKSLMLKDIVRVIARFERPFQEERRNRPPTRPAILPVEMHLQHRAHPTVGMTRIIVRFFIDWDSHGNDPYAGPNEWSPWLTGRWFVPDEYAFD